MKTIEDLNKQISKHRKLLNGAAFNYTLNNIDYVIWGISKEQMRIASEEYQKQYMAIEDHYILTGGLQNQTS